MRSLLSESGSLGLFTTGCAHTPPPSNYRPGDEIFLFGFSRVRAGRPSASQRANRCPQGAYTARMVALLIGAVGVLDRTEMDHFADIFLLYQKRGKAQDRAEIAALDAQLAPWTAHTSPGKRRADSGPDSFSIRCVGVFDTVGALGLPEELTHSEKMKTLFGFPDRYLGEHIERGYQALALDEHRKDFVSGRVSAARAGAWADGRRRTAQSSSRRRAAAGRGRSSSSAGSRARTPTLAAAGRTTTCLISRSPGWRYVLSAMERKRL